MEKKEDNIHLSRLLQTWYAQSKRELPWRDTSNPYLIWISEVILQQTRVNQGHDYFLRFVQQFPNVVSLAHAKEDEVLKMWQGLGYYSRARNLHAAAKQIVNDFHGVFPERHDDILSLKGVGAYTAAAVASIAYNAPYAVIDGNVYRVLSRLFCIDEPIDTGAGRKIFARIASDILDKENPGNHNQALMELGAMVCKPAQPQCDICPLQAMCMAYENKTISRFPQKRGRTKIKERFFHYFYVEQDGFAFIKKRVGNDIWKNLYEFPLVETDVPQDLPQLTENSDFRTLFRSLTEINITHKLFLKHVLTHRIVYINFYILTLDYNDTFDTENRFTKISVDQIGNYAVSRPIHKFLEG